MNKFAYSFLIVVLGFTLYLFTPITLLATNPVQRNKTMEVYVEKHYKEALNQMQRHSIPASIKLAQGLLETGAGKSSLALDHNNHFGIKCHTTWRGGKTLRTDDAPNECFRSYSSWQESYEDHSLFLKTPRYKSLFLLNLDDYIGWAKGLQQAGYATNKGYANSLIRIVENYELYMFDEGKLPSWMRDANHNHYAKKATNATLRPSYLCYDLVYVLAKDGESYEDVAVEVGISTKKLARYNDALPTRPLHQGEVVYLERKPTRSRAKQATHIVEVGDSMHSIAQMYGLRMSSLYELNNKDEEYVPVEGDILRIK